MQSGHFPPELAMGVQKYFSSPKDYIDALKSGLFGSELAVHAASIGLKGLNYKDNILLLCTSEYLSEDLLKTLRVLGIKVDWTDGFLKLLKAPTSQLQQIYHIQSYLYRDIGVLSNDGYDYLLDLSVLRGKLPNVKSLTFDLSYESPHSAAGIYLRVLDFLNQLEHLALYSVGAAQISLLQEAFTSANFSNLQDIVLLFLDDSSGLLDPFYASLSACSIPKLRSIKLYIGEFVESEGPDYNANISGLVNGLSSNTNLSRLNELSFKGLVISREVTTALAETIQNRKDWRSFKNLTLEYCDVSNIEKLFQGIQCNPNLWTLETLDFRLTSLANDGAKALADCLRQCKLSRLANLNLSWCDLGDQGVFAITSAIKENRSISNLTNLNLDANQISNDGIKAIGEMVRDSPHLGNLARLYFADEAIDEEGANFLYDCVFSAPHIKTLVFVTVLGDDDSTSGINWKVFSRIILQWRLPREQQEEFCFSDIEPIDLDCIANALRKSVFLDTARSLEFTSHTMKTSDWTLLFDSTKNSRSLTCLKRIRLGLDGADDAVTLIAQWLQENKQLSKLTKIHIGIDNLTDVGISRFLQGIQKATHLCSLHTLILACRQKVVLHGEISPTIWDGFQHCGHLKTLRHLKISGLSQSQVTGIPKSSYWYLERCPMLPKAATI